MCRSASFNWTDPGLSPNHRKETKLQCSLEWSIRCSGAFPSLSCLCCACFLVVLCNGFDPVQYTIWPPPTFSSCIRIFYRKSIMFCFYTLFLMVLTPYNIRYDIHSYSIVIKWFFIFLDIFKSSVLRCMSSYGARDFAVSLEISRSFCMHTLRRTIFSPRDREIF